MHTEWIPRSARLPDADAIADFNRALARETEGRELDPAKIGPGVRVVLGDATKGRYYVVESGGGGVGQVGGCDACISATLTSDAAWCLWERNVRVLWL